jgi:myo-inositol-1(or 4)-monophosphatase
MQQDQLRTYLEFARKMAYEAGQLTLEYFQKGLQPDLKLDGSPVTMADRRSEASIRRAIETKYPEHGILGEEFGDRKMDGAACRWIVDPIDGTQSFIHGVPLYSVLIGLEIEGRVEVGVAYFPALNEMVSAASGLGCWWNERSCRVSSVRDLSKAVVSHTDFVNFHKYGGMEAFERLARRAWYRPGWGDAYGYLLAATGRIEVMIDPIMAIWDCGPFPPIFREAGGYFGDWQGNETIYSGRGMATSQELLGEVLEILNKGDK